MEGQSCESTHHGPLRQSSLSDNTTQTTPSQPNCATTGNAPDGVEEGRHAYRPGGFHPVYVGDVYQNQYEVLSKIGYGMYSTVWLVRCKFPKHVFHSR